MNNWKSNRRTFSLKPRRVFQVVPTAFLLALTLFTEGRSHAATVLFSFDVQSVNANTVNVFLKETAAPSTEVIAAEGGLDFAGVRLLAISPPAQPVKIATVAGNTAFDVSQTVYNGSPSDLTLTLDAIANPPVFGSIGPNGGEILLGRFTFSDGLLGQTTFFKAVMIAPGDFTLTHSGAVSIEAGYGIADSAIFGIQGSIPTISTTPLPSGFWGGLLLLGTVGTLHLLRSRSGLTGHQLASTSAISYS